MLYVCSKLSFINIVFSYMQNLIFINCFFIVFIIIQYYMFFFKFMWTLNMFIIAI
jgi:hypothetical protein